MRPGAPQRRGLCLWDREYNQLTFGDVAQPGRAPDLHSGGRRFESDRLHPEKQTWFSAPWAGAVVCELCVQSIALDTEDRACLVSVIGQIVLHTVAKVRYR